MKFVSPVHRGTRWKWKCPGTPAPAGAPRFIPRLKPWGWYASASTRWTLSTSGQNSARASGPLSCGEARCSSGATIRWPFE